MQYKKMSFVILLMLIALIRPIFAEKSEIDLKVSYLESRYAEVQTDLNELQDEANRLEIIGYGGPVLRKDLKILAENIVNLRKELTDLDNELNQLAEGSLLNLPEFEINAAISNQGVLSKGGQVGSGDSITFRANVKFPEQSDQVITELIWQLFDTEGNEKTKLRKRIQLMNTDEEHPQEYGPITIDAGNLKDGVYKVALTHRYVEDPEIYFQDVFPFKLFQPVRIKKLVVTADPKDQAGRTFLYNNEQPFLYVYYKMADEFDKVNVEINVKDKKTGVLILSNSTERERKEGADIQRVGFRLKKGRVNPGSSLLFNITITTPDGGVETDQASFDMRYYTVTLNLPEILESEKEGQYRINVPPSFKEPYNVDMNASGRVRLSSSGSSLSGAIYGLRTNRNETARLRATVTDADGRIGKALAKVTITPKPEAKPKQVRDIPTYTAKADPKPRYTSKPKPNLPVRSESKQKSVPKVDYVALGNRRYREWLSEFLPDLAPYCASDLRSKWENQVKTSKLNNNSDAREWGQADSFRLYSLKQQAQKVLLKALIKQVKSVGYSDCQDKLASSLSASGEVNGLGNINSLYNSMVTAMKNNSGRNSSSSSTGRKGRNFSGGGSTGKRDTQYWMKCKWVGPGTRTLWSVDSIYASSPEEAIQKMNATEGGNKYRCWDASNAPGTYEQLHQEWCQQPGAVCR